MPTHTVRMSPEHYERYMEDLREPSVKFAEMLIIPETRIVAVSEIPAFREYVFLVNVKEEWEMAEPEPQQPDTDKEPGEHEEEVPAVPPEESAPAEQPKT